MSERLVELLDPRPGETVLELAAGIGETGFLAAARLGPTGRLLSTDVAPEMVDAARRRAGELGLRNVEHCVADMTELALEAESVDGVLCRFGVMLVPDVDAAAMEFARVLRPRGRAAFAVWASADENPWISTTGRVAIELGLADPPAPDAPGPFRFADPRRLPRLLDEVGLEVEGSEDVPIRWRAPSLDEWWETTRDTSRMLALLLGRLDRADTERLRRAAAERLAQFVLPDGSLEAPGLARVVRARRPG